MLRQVFPGSGVQHTPPPSLHLNFLSEVMDPRVTFSGGSGGTRVNSAGLIVAASCPRIDYDPVALACRGLLIEEQRTNLVLRSDDFTLSWAPAAATVGSNVTGAPDGTSNADKLQEDNTTATHIVQQFAAYSNAAAYTFSAYLKAGERSWAWLFFPAAAFTALSGSYFDLANGVVGNLVGSGVTASITPAGNGWYRCTITKTSTAAASGNTGVGAATANGTNNYAGTTGSGVYVWGAQLELGSFATSYIPTTTVAVTRTADSAVMTGANFSSWFNPTQGALYVEGDFAQVSAAAPSVLASIDDGTASNTIALRTNTGHTTYGLDAVINSIALSGISVTTLGSVAAASTLKAAVSWSSGNSNYAAGGLLGAGSATVFSGGSFTTLNIGRARAANNYLNGHARKIRSYPGRLPDSVDQTLTLP